MTVFCSVVNHGIKRRCKVNVHRERVTKVV